jgi:hypothetical protein
MFGRSSEYGRSNEYGQSEEKKPEIERQQEIDRIARGPYLAFGHPEAKPDYGQSEKKELDEIARDLDLGLALVHSDGFYSTAEGQAVEEFARSPEGKLDHDTFSDLLPFVRVYGRERGRDELRNYISNYGLEAARHLGNELREGKVQGVDFPSQALDAPDPAEAFGPIVKPIVGEPAYSLDDHPQIGEAVLEPYQHPIVDPASTTFPLLPVMPG